MPLEAQDAVYVALELALAALSVTGNVLVCAAVKKILFSKKKKKRKIHIYINCIVGNKQTGGINNSKN